MLRSLLNFVVFAALTVTILIGLFIAWWIAVCAVLGIAAWFWVMRLFGAKPLAASAAAPVVIEGQFQVEPEVQERIVDRQQAHLPPR